LPLYEDAEAAIKRQLERLAANEKPPVIVIGCFTPAQFEAINVGRANLELHLLEQNEILFLGRHVYASRTKDGYDIDDIIAQIRSALSVEAVAEIRKHMSCMQCNQGRDDGHGNMVLDRAIFEMTAKRPKAELFSVIPKGDKNKPKKEKAAEAAFAE
jgi:hypothetical protein